VDQVTQIDEPAVLRTSDALADLSARLGDAVGGLAGVQWQVVKGSEADAANGRAAGWFSDQLTLLAEEILDLSRSLYAAGTGFRSSDDATARRIGAAGETGPQ
jgi:predicted secreted hydrolase